MSTIRAWIARLRLRLSIDYATRRAWRALVTDALYVLALLLLILGALIVVEWNDQRLESRLRELEQRSRADDMERSLLACLNGRSTGLSYFDPVRKQRVYIVCDPAWYLPV